MMASLDSPGGQTVAADELLIRICTWNVAEINADAAAERDLYQWVFRREDEERGRIPTPDVMVVGLQEVDMSAKALITEKTKKGRKWVDRLCKLVDDHGNRQYRLVGQKQMMGIGLYIWAKAEVEMRLQSFEIVSTPTGWFNAFGNKGAVCARFAYNRKSFCFINAHLAAHQNKLERRNQDHDRILSMTAFKQLPQKVLSHDSVFWFGDLNYRLNVPRQVVVSTLENAVGSPDATRKLLSRHDQLYDEMRKGRAFRCFTEPEITWRPTYKLRKGEEGVYNEKRNPAYCDRILYATDADELPEHFFDESDSGDGEIDEVLNLFECVVCGRANRSGVLRKSGWKCASCVGTKSNPNRASPPPPRGVQRAGYSDDGTSGDSRGASPTSREAASPRGPVCPGQRRTRVRCLAYTDDPTATASDHRPVHGLFAVAGVFR